MITFSPRSITVHENDVPSVVSYNVAMREADGVTSLNGLSVPADPSGTTVISLASIIGITNVGRQIRLYIQEVGPTGVVTEFAPVGDVDGHGVFTIQEIPDGAESAIVNV